MEFFIAPIVEGHGEVDAFPALLHRVRKKVAPQATLRVNPAVRIKSAQFKKFEKEFEKNILLLTAKIRQRVRLGAVGLLITLLDCEDDCPAELGPQILQKQQEIASDVPQLVVLAYREYETWFLSAIDSLNGSEGLAIGGDHPHNPEQCRGAKEWLARYLPKHSYIETTHQLPFTKKFDMDQAMSNKSFQRLYQKLEVFFQTVQPHQ